MSIKYPPEVVAELIAAADDVLKTIIDGEEWGPVYPDPDHQWHVDEDGDPWYPEVWRLRNALQQIDECKKLATQIGLKAEDSDG